MTLHEDAVAVLGRWIAPTVAQERLRRVYLDHLELRPDAMSRHCHPDHITASVLVFSAGHDRVLLTLHKIARRWLQTGGHCEPSDQRLVDAALREGNEETGINDLRIDTEPVLLSWHEVPNCGPLRPSHHLDVQYVAVAAPRALHKISDESDDLQWFDVTALPANTDDSVRELTAACVRRLQENL